MRARAIAPKLRSCRARLAGATAIVAVGVSVTSAALVHAQAAPSTEVATTAAARALPPGSVTVAVNSFGATTGTLGSADGKLAAFRWSAEGGLETLSLEGEVQSLRVVGIAEDGTVLVNAVRRLPAGTDYRSWRFRPGTSAAEPLACAAGLPCELFGMNGAGDAVGMAAVPTLWPHDSDPSVALSSLPGARFGCVALNINVHGTIVGRCIMDTLLDSLAVAWVGPEHELRVLGPGEARTISDDGTVRGTTSAVVGRETVEQPAEWTLSGAGQTPAGDAATASTAAAR